ncbi:MAG: helix-turn-helix transcriptional regulator [Candidatus Eremiobacteraeota bacterium]|nr:helix-turn-helix transcriptional regulator [Candidatus Eremiobacteraeota bacterium]MBC5826118.1 helix-turn-helix transcriptional regulator [Candidatus Eremiobacteraeota bacterium]
MTSTRIRAHRLALGLSQQDLADKLNRDRAFISAIERTSGFPRLQTLELIARALQCTVSDLLPPSHHRVPKQPRPANDRARP